MPDDSASIIDNDRPGKHDRFPCGETEMPQNESTQQRKIKVMGDRSPKSNQKKSNQKQSKANSADQRKKDAVAAKSAVGKKK